VAISGTTLSKLPPPPDFRYVGLAAGDRVSLGARVALVGAAASVTQSIALGVGVRGAAFAAFGAGLAALAVGRMGPRITRAWLSRPSPMAIVPWGIIVDPEERTRVIRWAGVKSIEVSMLFGRDQATPTTLWSFVTIDTGRERLTGRTVGAVSLDRLLVYLNAYADEASHAVALDLEGEERGGGPTDPDVEPLLLAARAYVESASASQRLELPQGDYRHASSPVAGPAAVAHLREVLRDRTPHAIDPRPFAAVLAAELIAHPLADDLLDLAQSPHPVLAAVARAAARKLGVATARTGALDEVAPFLDARDVDVLAAWTKRARTNI
jgi:hypothetical protein